MFPTRLCFLAVSLAISASACAQATTEYPICGDTSLSVGEVPNDPFMATITEDAWQTASDGGRKPVDLQKKEPAYHVSRDSKGRVLVRSRGESTLRVSGVDQGQLAYWQDVICDPGANTLTRIIYHDVFNRAIDPKGQTYYSPAGKAGNEIVETQRANAYTTAVFRAYHRKINGREELAPEVFEGVPAIRYRFTKTGKSNPVLKDLANSNEVVISEDLEAIMAQVHWDEDEDAEREVKFTRIYRQEPPPSDFEPQQGLMLDRQQRQPSPPGSHPTQNPPSVPK